MLFLLLSAKTAMWSIQWIWLSGKMIMIHRINVYQCESMRITINPLIFIYLCHLALDHQRGKILFFMWFSLILNYSCWFLMILADSWWFSPIHDDSQISLELILVDSQISLNPDSHWFSLILNDSWWFSPILDDSWISLELIFIDSQISLNPDSHWFSMILTNFWWFSLILNDSHWFLMILE